MRPPTVDDGEELRLLFIQQVANAVIILWEPFDFSARIDIGDAILDREREYLGD
jgi:hypothetical protein